jgi:hypothetical protein
MEKAILVKPITKEELFEEIRKIIKEELVVIANKKDERLISASEACNLFVPKISKVTFYTWRNKGYFETERIGGKVYVKYSNILAALKTVKKFKKYTL